MSDEPESIAGQRRPDGTPFTELGPGDYVKRVVPESPNWERWWACCPDEGVVPLGYVLPVAGNGPSHLVDEHEDGTISVLPQAQHPDGNLIISPRGWRGYIRRGRWEAEQTAADAVAESPCRS